jgi:hypothetical protein
MVLRSWQLSQKANLLEQAEQFEDDYDDNDYSNYVEDVSVHAVTDIRLGLRWPAFMQTERRRWHWMAFGDAVDSSNTIDYGRFYNCSPDAVIRPTGRGQLIEMHVPIRTPNSQAQT